MPRLYNLHSHKELRRDLRRSATLAERHLWNYLKRDQLRGLRFRRQFSIGRYIVDFYCPKLRLIIEVDGSVHDSDEAKRYDLERTKFIESCHIRVVRFTNQEVLERTSAVLERLEEMITSP